MFYTFLKPKLVLAGVALLIVVVGVVIAVRPGVVSGGLGLVSEAWRTTFGGSGDHRLASDVDLYPSSTFSGPIEQDLDAASDSTAWPSLLIEPAQKSVIPKAGISKELETALNKAAVSVAATSTPSMPLTAQESPASAAPQWCDFSATQQGDSEVVLNEIAWMGSGQGADDEWIELKNTSGRSVDVGGWQMLNRSGSIKINIGVTSTTSAMARDSFLVLRRDEHYSGALPNTGDWLKVFNSECRVVDELNATGGWPAGNNSTKKTLERDVSGNGWHTSANVGGSPGAQNSANAILSSSTPTSTSTSAPTSTSTSTPTPSASSTPTINIPPATPTPTSTPVEPPPPAPTSSTPALTHVVIAEIQITGGEGMTDQDYVRVFNPSAESVDVSGWKLRKRTKTGTESSVKVFPGGSMILSGSYFTWANSADGFSEAIGANVSSTQVLSSDNSIALLNAEDGLVDAVAWGSDHATPYIEGSAYPENPGANQRLSRKLDGGNIRDTDSNSEDFELNP